MSSPDAAPSSPDRPSGVPSGVVVVELDDDALLARHAALSARDHVMGLEATVATLQRELAATKKRARRLRDNLEDRTEELAALRASRTWRVGRMLTAPGRRMRG